MVTIYNVISSDGYIARKDGSEDFIPDELWLQTLSFFKNYDTLVMGRKTYDAIQKYPPELIGPFQKLNIKKVVVTRDRNFKSNSQFGYIVVHSPEDALVIGQNSLVTSGPDFNTDILKKGLVDKVVYHKLAESIGEGIKPFNKDTRNILELTSEMPLDYGVTEVKYRVFKP